MKVRIGVALAVFACQLTAAEKKPLPWEKNRLQSGLALYRANCAVCHDVDKADSKKMGPTLYQLFKQATLPFSGDKVSRPSVKDKIQKGGIIMPGFNSAMNDAEIDLLLDYLQTK